ncbi:hypothetical protein [Aeromonas veronii]|uniref:hypothetical protein n=1 Tax=Aeromonas veronii TaxID=654 RepID=UPI0030E121D5
MNNEIKNQFTVSQPVTSTSNKDQASKVTEQPLVGRISNHIGTGANAKDSFIWMTITWSFYISSGLSILLFFKASFMSSSGSTEVIEHIKDVWSIFTPIITLALGYAFGKGQ